MTSPAELDRQKRLAAEAAVAEVRAGMLVGLGTGSTAAFAIAALGHRVVAGLAVEAVATSRRTAEAARAAGIAVRDLADVAAVDLAIDGVDEIDPGFRAIKGAGGAMLREKVVARMATRMIAIADAGKAVERLGARPVPLEILPDAHAYVAAAVAGLGSTPTLRRDPDGTPALTDQGNPVLDCAFPALADPAALAAALDGIAGLIGHGLFVTEIDALYLGAPTGVEHRSR